MEFERIKEEERRKIEHEKKIQIRNTKLLRDFPSKKEREEIDNLKEQMMKLQEESKSKDQRNKLAIDRLKRQLEESIKKNENLKIEIKYYEDRMNEKGIKVNKYSSTNKIERSNSKGKGVIKNSSYKNLPKNNVNNNNLNDNNLNSLNMPKLKKENNNYPNQMFLIIK